MFRFRQWIFTMSKWSSCKDQCAIQTSQSEGSSNFQRYYGRALILGEASPCLEGEFSLLGVMAQFWISGWYIIDYPLWEK